MRARLVPTRLVVLSLVPLATPLSAATDWPCWRGPHGDNVSRETAWSSAGADEPLWSASVGRGYSSPCISDGRVYIAGFFEDGATPGEGLDRVSCLAVEDGAEIWSFDYPTRAWDNEHRGGALSTPTVFEGVLYVASRGGSVRAFDAAEGGLLWEVDLVERHGVDPGRYGFASSPFVSGKGIVLNASRTVALDRASGETLWISEPLDASYSTVAPVERGGRPALAAFGGNGLALLDAEDGSQLGLYVFRKTPRNVEGATPIVLGEQVIVSSGYDQGIARVDFSGEEPVEVWRSRAMRTKMAGCTLFDGYLYGFDESILKCVDLEGKEQWRVRGLGHGALGLAGGRLLVTTSEGELIVARATPEGFEEQSRRTVLEDGGVFWTAPVLSDGRVYFRGSRGDLVCLDHRDDRGGSAMAATSAGEEPGAADLPAAADLLARHLERTRLGSRPAGALSFRGRVSNDSLGLKDSEALWETEARRWHTRVALPFGGMFIDRFVDGDAGWEQNPYRGNKLLEGAELAELRGCAGFRSLVDPFSGAVEGGARTVARETFRGIDCYRVDLDLGAGAARSVYFDAATGRLAGRTGAAETTVRLDDWREVEGVELPFRRTEFTAETGEEWRWRFESADLEPLEDELFVLPEDLRAGGESGPR